VNSRWTTDQKSMRRHVGPACQKHRRKGTWGIRLLMYTGRPLRSGPFRRFGLVR